MTNRFFFFALVSLIVANVVVISCKKESAPSEVTPAASTGAADDRSTFCPDLHVYDGNNLIICGVDSGSDCTLCGNKYHSVTVTGDNEVYPFHFSSVLYICNPTGAAITFGLGLNCYSSQKQTFTLQSTEFQKYHIEVVNNCCTVVQGIPNCI